MCYIEGGICIVSADFLAVPVSNSQCRIGTIPNGMKPLGRAAADQTGSEGIAYIAPLGYRGDNSKHEQLMVNNSGEITVWAERGASDDGYYYGYLVFPVTSS